MTEADLYELDPQYHPQVVYDQFWKAWNAEERRVKKNGKKTDKTPSLWTVLARLYLCPLLLAGLFLFTHYFTIYANARLIEEFVLYIATPDAPIWLGIALIGGLFGSSLINSITWQHYNARCNVICMRVRTTTGVLSYLAYVPLFFVSNGVASVRYSRFR